MTKSIDVRTPGIQAIAKKWKLSIPEVMRLVNDGAKVEKEHTKSLAKARQVARDHIAERPDYYKKLHKMEKSPISMKEETGISGIRGLGNVTGDPALDPVNQYINTNVMSYEDYNGAILRMIRDRHNQHAALGFTSYDPTDHESSNKPLKESDESTKALVRTVAKKKLKDISGKKKSQALRDKLTRKMNLKELGDFDKSGSEGAEGLSDAPARSMKKVQEMDTSGMRPSTNIDDRRGVLDTIKGAYAASKKQYDKMGMTGTQAAGGAAIDAAKSVATTAARNIRDFVTSGTNTNAAALDKPTPKAKLSKDATDDIIIPPAPKLPGSGKLNELKDETLGSYIKKAAKSRREALNKGGAKADVTTWAKRQKGITTAIKKLTNEESQMENKDLINEALENILEENLSEMKDNLTQALQEKAMEKLEERKKEIAANYFAQ